MIASVRDVISTAFVAVAAALAWGHATGADIPFTDSARVTAGLVYLFGLGACATFSAESWESDPTRKRWYHRIGSLLSVVATGALVWALVTGATAAVVLLAVTVLVKWAMATLRHLLTKAPVAA
ncbi:hypothetical protein [Demequina mangrovi]|uniref:Low temperature requirement A protein (LtrA) n=1 Tax=Demequina mangrovi TaxID=1043493 RepID=A0A1H7AZ91_9MICO|nr:hypothetical protein [Demequina mangrovi]SEJ69247.1 hypothetical protein SAMN05421637_2700 [Demequina mangrovi]